MEKVGKVQERRSADEFSADIDTSKNLFASRDEQGTRRRDSSVIRIEFYHFSWYMKTYL